MSVRLIGGEMAVWSDLDGGHGPGPVRGQVLLPLLATATGRTLVAGPHDPALIDAVPAAELTLLVRSLPDAEALAARYADRPGTTVCCGGLEKLIADPPYDTVVALDGVTRLSSVEGAELSWGEAFELLVTALRPGGGLMLGVENHLGLHRLVALAADPSDSDWAASGEYDPSRPAGVARVRDRLRDAGLEVARTYAAFPALTSPTALLGADVLADGRLHGFLAATLRHACAPTGPVLTDPARLAASVLRHGVAVELAPAWILLARWDGPSPNGALPPTLDLVPDAVVVAGAARYDIRRHADRWVRRRDGSAGSEPVPDGPTLEDVLIGACVRRDLPALRELLTAWQDGAASGVPADQVIVGPDGGLTALAPAGEPAAALRQFAATLIGGGVAHPWPAPPDAADLALTLAAMAGRDIDPPGSVAADGGDPVGPDARAFRDVAADRDRLARELAEARAKALWYEQMLTARETSLKQAQRIVTLLVAGSRTARAGSAVLGGARRAWRTFRVALRRIRRRS